MKKWIRNLMTRCVAITPSLIVSIIGGSNGAARLIIIASVCKQWTMSSFYFIFFNVGTYIQTYNKNLMGFALQMILAFELPFALIPLLKFSSSATKMGPHMNSIYVSWFCTLFLFLLLLSNEVQPGPALGLGRVGHCLGPLTREGPKFEDKFYLFFFYI